MSPFLEVRSLTAQYNGAPVPVLNGVSFILEKGTVLAILGPSGCGKTTLLNILVGVMRPRSGQTLLDGAPLSTKTTPVGLVPQGYGLLPWKTVRQNCLFPLGTGAKSQERERELDALCTRLGIGELLNRYPRSLSGGQAQRAALARALLLRPRLLLLDEPFGALDDAASASAQTLFRSLCKEQGLTAIVVTHRQEEALYLADRIAVMEPGGCLSIGGPSPCQKRFSPEWSLEREAVFV